MGDKVDERKAIVQEREICCNPTIHTFTGERKKLGRSSVDPQLSTLRFYENIE